MKSYDLVIVGAGAAGSEAAFSVADGGKHSILIAESSHFGGTCTNHGCVPTKALVRSAKIMHLINGAAEFGIHVGQPRLDWAEAIGRANRVRDHMLRFGAAPFEEAGVEVRFPCTARFTGEHTLEVDGEPVQARAALIAAGLEPALPPVPGLRESGCLDNEGALALKQLPRRLAVIGSGPIGCEFAQIFARFGVEVTLLELDERILPPEEPESAAAIHAAFLAEGIAIRTGIHLTRVERQGAQRRLTFEVGPPLDVDEVLVAVGRSFDGGPLGLDAAGVAWTRKGVTVNSNLRSSQPWVWAAGDVVGGALFTHVASEMGQLAARNALHGTSDELDLRVVPRVTFTDPEVASVGLTEKQARAAGHALRVGFAPLKDAEKAIIDGQAFGHVKVVADAVTGEMLGCHMVAETAGDMIHEAVAIMSARAPVGVVGASLHAYPTLSELTRSALREAAG